MLYLIFTFVLFNFGLLALEIPRHGLIGPNWFALEAFALVGLFTLLPARRWARLPAWMLGVTMALLTLLAVADAIARLSLNRQLNLYLDWPHVASIYHLIVGNLSLPVAIVATLALLLLLAGVAWLTARLLTHLAGPKPRPVRAVALVLAVIGLVGTVGGATAPQPPKAVTPGKTLVVDQIRWATRTHAEHRAFEQMLATANDRTAPLEGLQGVDVILGLLESYGVSATHDERYAAVVRPQLAALEAAVEARGLHMVSGTINAPMFGGQSWLAHSTLLSGLWIDSHLRYELMLESDWHSLVEEFNRTGHRTVALMPANVQPWPARAWYGYDAYYDAEGLDYHGPPFHWVTMPDQYVWSFFENEVRRPSDEPVFAKLALISSHAPWVPILPVIEDWDTIGDGSIFDQWDSEGETPQSLWQDRDRVREHFARSVAYAVEVAAGYAERYVDDNTLLIIMGDHQPAPMITGPEASPAVPMHVISGDPALVEPFRRYGFVAGAIPPGAFTDHSMDAFRGWLHEGFGEPAAGTAAHGTAAR